MSLPTIGACELSSLAMFMHPSVSQRHAGIHGCPILSQRQACVRHLVLRSQVTSSKHLLGTDAFRIGNRTPLLDVRQFPANLQSQLGQKHLH